MHTKGLFGEHALLSKRSIPTSLLKINSDFISCVVKVFQVILKYMGMDASDRETLLSFVSR
jgi:hypothetical protein